MAMMRPENELKDSGIEWVGSIPEDWKVAKNNRLFNISKEIVNENWKDTQLLSLTKSGIVEKNINDGGGKQPESFETYQYVEKDDIVLCLFDIDVSAVFSDRSKYDGMISSAYRVIKCTNAILSVYAKWWFDAVNIGRYYLIYTKSLRKTIDADGFGNILTVVPPLSEQQAIADYLDETCSQIDEIIAEAKASIDEYKKLRESVISNATTRGIKKNRSMKSSGAEWVLEIPSDWDMIPTKVLFSQSNERKHANDVQLTASQKYGIISQVEYMKRENSKIVIATQGIENWKHVEPNDFIISLRSFQGGLEKSDVSGCITWHYVVLKANNGVYYDYFKWLFKSDKYINALQGTCNFIRDGQDLRFSNFVQVPLLAVPIEEQKEIADYLNKEVPKIDSLISEKESLINDLEAYKKSLIYEVVTGKRRVV